MDAAVFRSLLILQVVYEASEAITMVTSEHQVSCRWDHQLLPFQIQMDGGASRADHRDHRGHRNSCKPIYKQQVTCKEYLGMQSELQRQERSRA